MDEAIVLAYLVCLKPYPKSLKLSMDIWYLKCMYSSLMPGEGFIPFALKVLRGRLR